MKALDAVILLFLFLVLAVGLGLLWLNIPGLPGQPFKEQEFNINKTELNYETKGVQFYPNMRYRDKIISYSVSNSCDLAKKKDVERAFAFLAERTILDFKESPNGELSILCSEIAPEPEEKGHFVAGEGGPSEIINTTTFSVILSGKVSLYRRTNECVRPNVAIHEILHALGFDHNNNAESIMYPVTDCDQILDTYIVNEINSLYSTESASDLMIEKVRASQTGKYLNFEITIGNFGLKDSPGSNLIIYSDDTEVKTFVLEEIEIGTRKILNVTNLRVPLSFENLEFEVKSSEKEIDKRNNIVELKLEEIGQ
ncbi:MAG: matrixin family metalloprotease [Nanoarchaeota archaeon]|nr:matrixin family metalloprotease [Nanoarchaeota archaeon]